MASRAKSLQALASSVQGLAAAWGAVGTEVKAVAGLVASAAPAMAAQLTQTGNVATQVAKNAMDATNEWHEQQLAMLEKLRLAVIPFEGTDAGTKFSFDKIIEDQITKVKAGDETATDAIQELQRQLGSVYGTFQKKFFGSQDPGAQAFLEMLEQFVNSGNINP